MRWAARAARRPFQPTGALRKRPAATRPARAAAGPDLRSVAGACTGGQARNIALCGQLAEVHRSLATLLPRLPPPAAAALACALPASPSKHAQYYKRPCIPNWGPPLRMSARVLRASRGQDSARRASLLD
jgi:hypothetical protein